MLRKGQSTFTAEANVLRPRAAHWLTGLLRQRRIEKSKIESLWLGAPLALELGLLGLLPTRVLSAARTERTSSRKQHTHWSNLLITMTKPKFSDDVGVRTPSGLQHTCQCLLLASLWTSRTFWLPHELLLSAV